MVAKGFVSIYGIQWTDRQVELYNYYCGLGDEESNRIRRQLFIEFGFGREAPECLYNSANL